MEWMILPLRRYAEFSGRSRRLEFWMFGLFQVILMVGWVIVSGLLGFSAPDEDPNEIVSVPIALFLLCFAVPNIAVTVRRFHDQDMSGWMYLLALIPYLGGLVILVFMCLRGTRGTNRFGPDPLRALDPNVDRVFS